MQLDEETRETLVAQVYAAAVGRLPWETALETFRLATGAWMVQLLALDKRSGAIQFSHASGGSAEAHLSYVRTYHRIDPRTPLMVQQPGSGWMHCHDFIDEAAVAANPFYQEFLIPFGGRYLTATKLVDDETLIVGLGAIRGVGHAPIELETLNWMNRARPHLVEAIANYRHLSSLHMERSAGHVILDQLRQPVMLVDASRALHYANPAARAALSDARHVVNRQGLIACRRARDDGKLTSALQALALDTVEGGNPPRKLIRLDSDGEGQAIVVCASPLRPADVMGSFGKTPLVMLLFHDPAAHPVLDPFIVAEVFDFTPAEARVAVMLAEGEAVNDIALRRQVSIHTVRSQVRAMLFKTGSAALLDLVGRVRSLAALPG